MSGKRRRWTSWRAVLALAVPPVVLVTLLIAASHAEETKAAAVPKQELQAKLAYCQVCHGAMGQGFRGYYPIPRLAGQQPEYFENQLQAFIEHRRTNNIMFNVAHVMSPEMLSALAASFQAFNPKPLGGAPKDMISAGEKIYRQGIPATDVPPCATCHGDDAKGNGQFPRLAGQLNDYIVNKLTNWTAERGQNPSNPDASSIMQPIAHNLTKPQIEAIAAYVSNLE